MQDCAQASSQHHSGLWLVLLVTSNELLKSYCLLSLSWCRCLFPSLPHSVRPSFAGRAAAGRSITPQKRGNIFELGQLLKTLKAALASLLVYLY